MPFNITSRGYLPPAHFKKARFFFMLLTNYTFSGCGESSDSIQRFSNSRNDKPLREITLITSDRPDLTQRFRPRVFGLDICWQCRTAFFASSFEAYTPETRTYHGDHYASFHRQRSFSDSLSSPTVQVVVVRGTAQLQSVMAGRADFNEPTLPAVFPPAAGVAVFAPGMPSVLEP